MSARLRIGDREFSMAPGDAVDLSIPLLFAGPQPNHFGAPRATARPLEVGGFVGDTTRGGSCNVPEIRLVPHCNGTHTESVGHLESGAGGVLEAVPAGPVLAALVTISPDAGEITGPALEQALEGRDGVAAAVLRTLPNPEGKRSRIYGVEDPPPYLAVEAAAVLTARGIDHVLVDVPSLDPMYDEGRLAAHHAFFENRRDRTVTEMIYVPDDVPDGLHALLLQVAPFALDAAPSRPILYPLVT